MNRRSPLARLQRQLLQALASSGVLPKDEAHAAAVGVDRTTVQKQREGTRPMTVGQFIRLLLSMNREDALVAVAELRELARIPEDHLDDDTSEDGLVRLALDLSTRAGAVAERTAEALDDEVVSDDERTELHRAAKDAWKAAAKLVRLTKPRSRT